MGLQVRLRHALGERVLDLPDRGVDHPLMIGRAADADVQVPSVHVGPRHLALFVHEGRWLAQDVPGGTGTTVNGAALKAARPLQGGDVLALGPESDPPTIEVDADAFNEWAVHSPPAADSTVAMAAGETGASSLPPPLSRPATTAPAAAAVSPQFAPPVPEVAVELLNPDGESAATAASAADEAAMPAPQPEWMTNVSAPRTAGRRRRSWVSHVTTAVSVVLSVAIVTAAVLYVYVRQQEKEERERLAASAAAQAPRQPAAAAPASSRPATRPAPAVRVFDVPPAPAAVTPPPLADITEELDVSPPAAGATTGGPPADAPSTRPATSPRRVASRGGVPDPQFFGDNVNDSGAAGGMGEEEREWKRVEGVYYNPNIAKALLSFDAFAERFPDARKEQLAKYREDMLDKLWWTRIESLMEKRKKTLAQIKDVQTKIKNETEEPFKKTVLEPQLEAYKADLAAVDARLRKDMAYTLDAAPPIGNELQMKALRAKRDPITYRQWKEATLKHIRNNHGAYPWANEG